MIDIGVILGNIFTSWIFIGLCLLGLVGFAYYYLYYKKKKEIAFDCYIDVIYVYNGSRKTVEYKGRVDEDKNLLFILFKGGEIQTQLPNLSECAELFRDKYRLKLFKSANQTNTYYPIPLKVNLTDTDKNGIPDIYESPIKTDDMNMYETIMYDKVMKYQPHNKLMKLVKFMMIISVIIFLAAAVMNGYIAKKTVSLGQSNVGVNAKMINALERSNDLYEQHVTNLDSLLLRQKDLYNSNPPD